MKKFLILPLLIQASMSFASTKNYPNPRVKLDLSLIDKYGNIDHKTYQSSYDQHVYTIQGQKGNSVNTDEVIPTMKNFFELGKSYISDQLSTLQTKFNTMSQEKDLLQEDFDKVKNQSLIQFLNNYSIPAKIGFGIAGIVVVASLVYSGRQLYFFGKQKYSDWKAKKEESES